MNCNFLIDYMHIYQATQSFTASVHTKVEHGISLVFTGIYWRFKKSVSIYWHYFGTNNRDLHVNNGLTSNNMCNTSCMSTTFELMKDYDALRLRGRSECRCVGVCCDVENVFDYERGRRNEEKSDDKETSVAQHLHPIRLQVASSASSNWRHALTLLTTTHHLH